MGLATVGLAGLAMASSVERLTWNQLVTRSEVIFHGRCTGIQSFRDSKTGIIWTRFSFSISETFNGVVAGRDMTITEPGGVFDGVGQIVPGAPRFGMGEEVILFVYRTELGKWRVRGLGQGHFRVETPVPGGDQRVHQVLRGLELLDPVGQPLNTAASAPRENDLNPFLSRLRRTVSALRKAHQ